MPKPLPPPWDRFVPVFQKVLVWALFFGVLWFLRPFFFLVFLTFVFGYIQAHAVDKLEGRIPKRWVRVTVVFLGLLAVLVGLGAFIGPDLANQAKQFPSEVKKHVGTVDEELARLRAESDFFRDVIPAELKAWDIVGELTAPEAVGDPAAHPEERLRALIPTLFTIAGRSLAIGSSFLLSLLFSFLIVLDMPKLGRGVKRLHDTRMRFVYDEIYDSVFHFGHVLGRALEAQLMIAILNTAFTAVGLSVMGLPSIAFLSAVVFVCSFIPVAGVFISSVPICLTALAQDGLHLMMWAIAFITVIHMIEAYILNPRIYGAHLRMNPVIVLAILVVSHHLFGIWGLILGVPVTNYVYHHVILAAVRPPDTPDVSETSGAGDAAEAPDGGSGSAVAR